MFYGVKFFKNMKKLVLFFVTCILVGTVCLANDEVQPNSESTNNTSALEVTAPLSGTCTVKVYWRSNGKTYPYKDCKVQGQNSDGFCKTVYTNSDGEVSLSWVGSGNLFAIYINGKEYDGKYENGGTYTFYVED